MYTKAPISLESEDHSHGIDFGFRCTWARPNVNLIILIFPNCEHCFLLSYELASLGLIMKIAGCAVCPFLKKNHVPPECCLSQITSFYQDPGITSVKFRKMAVRTISDLVLVLGV